MSHCRFFKACFPSARKIIIVGEIQHVEDRTLEILHTSNEDSSQGTVQELKDLVQKYHALAVRDANPRKDAIEKLKEALL